MLTDEINYLVNGTYCSERALVFSSVILRDHMVQNEPIFANRWRGVLGCSSRETLTFQFRRLNIVTRHSVGLGILLLMMKL